ncbi:hypothetical protein AB0D59_09745 [Streptomyces sp. NPDC048417]|uniref:hypothetical protein n=1 Tax=Streptomyces sp. NPDC048417 TaxID=3155387 RepID=UPI003422A16D
MKKNLSSPLVTAIAADAVARRQNAGRAAGIRAAQAIQGARAARAARATAKAQAIARAHAQALQRRAATMIGSDVASETASALFTGLDGGGGTVTGTAAMPPECRHAPQARACSL